MSLCRGATQLGGRCTSQDVHVPELGTFRFDTGPSLLLFPHVYERVGAEGRTAACSGVEQGWPQRAAGVAPPKPVAAGWSGGGCNVRQHRLRGGVRVGPAADG